jgi:hypothetical protein
MIGSLLFVLPDGRSADVSAPSARLICDRLWEFGIAPGAATAAARISDALHTHTSLWGELAFSEREAMPLLVASEVAHTSWSLPSSGKPPPLEHANRARLLAECDALLASLNGRSQQGKLQTVIADIERFRNSLHTAG